MLMKMPQIASPILKASQMPQTIEIATSWGAAKLTPMQIQRLVMDEDGNLVYQEDPSLMASATEKGITLISEDLACPNAGSYRIIVQWIWDEVMIKEQVIYFFINTH